MRISPQPIVLLESYWREDADSHNDVVGKDWDEDWKNIWEDDMSEEDKWSLINHCLDKRKEEAYLSIYRGNLRKEQPLVGWGKWNEG